MEKPLQTFVQFATTHKAILQIEFNFMKFENKFVERLVELRNDRSLSQRQLAEALGSKRTTVSSWENGVSEPNITTLIKIAVLFDVSVDYLIGLEN